MGDKDFFLSTDDAQTMGDIDYMRTAKRTRRTFPKTLANKKGFAVENEVSSTEDRSGMFKEANDSNEVTFSSFQPTSTPAPAPQVEGSAAAPEPAPAPSSTQRRKSDSSMDMFRNMAKNIRK